MNKHELLNYIKQKNKAKQAKWLEQIKMHGECQPLTADEYLRYNDIIITGKKSHKIKFVHNKLWSIYDE